ncbi:MAG: phosphoribosylformimino-5-aminoimidazole carboxamide ribotide isomerase [Lachnospiraceae bacterium]|nr:phosphoribosylformimino-5-aminoimidazole carboxamide ribotide isomerase [Lachnospiraceae bacterium]
MHFRPCIDIHNGRVKQIVGNSLRDEGDTAVENFVAERSAASFAEQFRRDGLPGGHVVVLNQIFSPYYAASRAEALSALEAFPGGFQYGGGVTADNASYWLNAGASHVIVTSYVFRDGKISYENLAKLESAVGRNRIVLDLSCAKRDDSDVYYIMTDRWQRYADTPLNGELMERLSGHCAEFLIHAISKEGRGEGIDEELIYLFSESCECPITYAGGVRNLDDLEELYAIGDGRIDFTVGSALSLYGGSFPYTDILQFSAEH